MPSPPLASSIALPAFKHILSLYPSVIQAFYATKVKDSKKRQEALENDKWRYEELIKLAEKWKKDDGLSKAQLERLVQWKITHGTYRPFLPSQIRKNDPQTVKSETATAHHSLVSHSDGKNIDQQILRKNLDGVCKLTGVGPATGTLLLSVFKPDSVVFFEDELYYWLLPHGQPKLKYTVKEYFELYHAANELRSRLSREAESEVCAWEVEKVGFVIGHWDLVGDEDQAEVSELTNGAGIGNTDESNKATEKRGLDDDGDDDRTPLKELKKRRTTKKPEVQVEESQHAPNKAQKQEQSSNSTPNTVPILRSRRPGRKKT